MAEMKRVKRKYLIDAKKSVPKQSKRNWLKTEILPFTDDDVDEVERELLTSQSGTLPCQPFDHTPGTSTDTLVTFDSAIQEDDVEPDNDNVSDCSIDDISTYSCEVLRIFQKVLSL